MLSLKLYTVLCFIFTPVTSMVSLSSLPPVLENFTLEEKEPIDLRLGPSIQQKKLNLNPLDLSKKSLSDSALKMTDHQEKLRRLNNLKLRTTNFNEKQMSQEELKAFRSKAYVKAKNLRALKHIGLKIEANAREQELANTIKENVRRSNNSINPVLHLLRDAKTLKEAKSSKYRTKPSPVKYEDSLKEFPYFSKQFEGMDEKEFSPNQHRGISENFENSFSDDDSRELDSLHESKSKVPE